ncbi:TIGR00725 family protein [Actinomadura sp. WAC 06369]|uniref:TIGR00725 family protein n=1 Tax=Actinomadura sp. WAC 06369 TaxID=2203193 RepID=UPI000F78D82C|nr:TIGR00725 family protein [Actinomadura sp. WAC 06369]RSN40371.1 TIGR00725 family protein [Actinomadura sp. WAC 06369]
MTGAPPVHVAVCGPADCTRREHDDARELGRLLAARGAVVVCGGHGGVMAAVAAGARDAGGTVVGVLPGDDRTGADPHLTVALPTGLGQARNALIVNAADAVLAVGGSWGTLSEIALAVRRGRAPVVQLGGWRVHDEHGDPVGGVRHARDPADAIARTGLWPARTPDPPGAGPPD